MSKPINIIDIVTRVCLGPGSVTESEHAALRDITQPVYGSLAWRTALGIVESRMNAAWETFEVAKGLAEDVRYYQGRYDALVACLEALKERGEP